MDTEYIIWTIVVVLGLIKLISIHKKPQKKDRWGTTDDRSHKKRYGNRRAVPASVSTGKNPRQTSKARPQFTPNAISWCSSFLGVEPKVLSGLLNNTAQYYTLFSIRKRSGGFRTISAPNNQLRDIQRAIYHKILFPVHIHQAATGFRPRMSVKDNAGVHLGNSCMLKTDIHDFFGSIPQQKVRKAFEAIGYPYHVSKVLAHLCCRKRKLPQGAPTSPALSNIIANSMDTKMAQLAHNHGLCYSRYADDMVFSGNTFDCEKVLASINQIVREEGYVLNQKKTRFRDNKRRKIITGISISSGMKLTIPKSAKREIRKNVYFVLKYGVKSHQRQIGSKDPVYLKRLMGQLSFWLSVEPDNAYILRSLNALRRLDAKL